MPPVKKLTITSAAARLGVTRPYLSGVLHGRHSSIRLMRRLEALERLYGQKLPRPEKSATATQYP